MFCVMYHVMIPTLSKNNEFDRVSHSNICCCMILLFEFVFGRCYPFELLINYLINYCSCLRLK